MPTFPNKIVQNSQTRQLQAILDTHSYSTSAFVPTKTITVCKIHSYNHLWKLATPNFWIFCSFSSSCSVKLAYCKSGKVLTMVFKQNGSFLLLAWSLTKRIFVTLLKTVLSKISLICWKPFSVCACTCIMFHRKVGLKCVGPREWVEGGGASANTSKYIRMVKHSTK